jgi:apolipoprotein N-acyltransferase
MDNRQRLANTPLSPACFLLALAAGGLTVFAFAPFHFWPLQTLALGVLFLLILHAPTVRAAMQLGWAFGFASVAAGTYWLYISLHDVGGLPALLAVAAVGLLAALLGLFYALAAGAASRLTQRKKNAAMTALGTLPACWMLADWTRGWLFTGFSWVATGYAHNASPLSGFAPLVGVYGLSWLAALLAGGTALMVQQRALHKGALALLILIPVTGLALQTIHWTTPLGQPLSVRLLQGNVPQDLKFDRAQLALSLALYQDMIMQAPADLIATPETALPVLATQLPAGYLEKLTAYGRDSGSTILAGVPWTTAPGVYLNSVLGMSDGLLSYRYDKHHLVPFGEFIPPGARWFVELMQIPLGDFGRGDLLQPPIRIKDQWLLPNICYEDLFGEEIAAQLAAAHSRGSPQASVLLNVSNIAWFGDSIALPQHLQISQMRTLETGRPMLRATNTGATAVIDARGNIIARLPPFTRGTLAAQVQGQQGQTPYIVLGNSVPVGLAWLLLLILWWIVRRQSRLAE